MASKKDLTNLLTIIKRLYSRIMTLRLETHASSNHYHNNTTHSRNIVSSLSKCIDKLATDAEKHPVNEPDLHIADLEHYSHTMPPINHETSHTTSSNSKPAELSEYLKNSHQHFRSNSVTGNKLIQSTWEHLHASIRLARLGDVKNARLHSELTKNALNEATHYLSEQEYSRFSKDVIQALEEINSEI
jgi:hypothetical protein